MSNDRRTFLDGSTAPRKPLPAPLTEGAMKAAMEDWLEALPKPAVKEFFGVQKKFPNPKDKKTVDAKNLEILKKYKVKPLIGDPSHRESLSALSCCLDMLVGGQGESVEVGGDSIEEVMGEAKKIKYPEDLQYKNHRDMTPAEKQKWIAWSRAYNLGVQTRDFSGVETSPSLGTKSKEYQDAWKAWNRQRTVHAANRDFHLIKPFVAPKEKTKKKTKDGKKAYFMDYPNKYEEVAAEVDGDSIEEMIAKAKNLLVELVTPERRDELEKLYFKAEDKFMKNIASDALMNALNAIEDKLHKEALSKSTYGKGGKIVKRVK